MGEPEKETGRGEIDFFHGQRAQLLDQSVKNTGIAKTQYNDWGKNRESIRKNKKDGGSCPEEERQERGAMRDTTRKFAKRKKNEGGEQTQKANAPERTKRNSNGKTGGRTTRGGGTQDEQYARKIESRDKKHRRGRRNRRSRK